MSEEKTCQNCGDYVAGNCTGYKAWCKDWQPIQPEPTLDQMLSAPSEDVWDTIDTKLEKEIADLKRQLAEKDKGIKRLKNFITDVANIKATGGDPEYECELCRGELQHCAKVFLKELNP